MFPDGLGGDSDGSLSGRRVSAQVDRVSARDETVCQKRCGKEDAAARRGRAQGRTKRASEDCFPTSGVVACALLYVKVVSQRFGGKFLTSC